MDSTFAAQALQGLSTAEAARRLSTDGENEVAEPRDPLIKRIAVRFWAPIPWTLVVIANPGLVVARRSTRSHG